MNIKTLAETCKPEPAITIPVLKNVIKKLGYSKKLMKKETVTSNNTTFIEMRYLYSKFYK